MRFFIVFISLLISPFLVVSQEVGPSFFLEAGGKGFFSLNADFPINEKLRWGTGVTVLDYTTKEPNQDLEVFQQPSPGAILYFLNGKNNHYLEFSAGFSMSPTPNKNWDINDSWLSLHGGIGYRYMKDHGLFFRAGIYPFYRLNWTVLPLPGLSIGATF